MSAAGDRLAARAIALDHVHIRSHDPEAAAQFFVDRLGGSISGRIETAEMLRVIVAMPGVQIFIERVPDGTRGGPAERPHRGLEHIGFRVQDLDAAAAELKAAGVRFTVEPKAMGPGLRIAFILGPEDVLIELLERSGG